MKNKFKGYYKPQPEDLKKIWDDCIFIFDTNVLFDFYRYSDDTVGVLFSIFEKLEKNIWIPHWVGLEYHRGLEERIKEQVDKYTSTLKDLSNFRDKIKTQREHPFLSLELQEKAQVFYEEYDKELSAQKKKLKELIVDNPVKERIATLIGDNIGEELTDEEITEIIKIGDERLDKNVPPGYIDYKEKRSRPGLDKYGDYIIWYQILKKIQENKKSFLFITFDTKEDWYKLIKFNNSKVLFGPRPELIEEFIKTCGTTNQEMWLYSTPDFIEYAIKHLNIDIEDSQLEKVKEETKNLIKNEEDCLSEVKNENESTDYIEKNTIGGSVSNATESNSTI